MTSEVSHAYSARATEYIGLLGSLASTHPSDRELIGSWADQITGPALDAGCGPGHWTQFVNERLSHRPLDPRSVDDHSVHPRTLDPRSVDPRTLDPRCVDDHSLNPHDHLHARGIDLVPEFIEHARAAHPGSLFSVGSVDAIDAPDASLGGVLAWYSLIHHEPDAIRVPLDEFARVLRPGGLALIGFFEGPTIERFEHAVMAAYRWPVAELGERLRASGFTVVKTHTRTGERHRPHGAILAKRTINRPRRPIPLTGRADRPR